VSHLSWKQNNNPNLSLSLLVGVIFVSSLEYKWKPSVSYTWNSQLVSSLWGSLTEPCELLIFSCSDYLAYCTAHSLKQQKNPILKTNVGLFIFKLASHYLTLIVSGALKAIDSLFTWTLEPKYSPLKSSHAIFILPSNEGCVSFSQLWHYWNHLSFKIWHCHKSVQHMNMMLSAAWKICDYFKSVCVAGNELMTSLVRFMKHQLFVCRTAVSIKSFFFLIAYILL